MLAMRLVNVFSKASIRFADLGYSFGAYLDGIAWFDKPGVARKLHILPL
jgi:hypothetical protein